MDRSWFVVLIDRISSVEDILLNVWMLYEKHRSFYDTQRAQPTLRLHSSRFVVESCDVFCRKHRTLFEQFGNTGEALPHEAKKRAATTTLKTSPSLRGLCSLRRNPLWRHCCDQDLSIQESTNSKQLRTQ